MKFTARSEIAAPLPEVWARLTDFARFEAAARRQGTAIHRTPDITPPHWQIAREYRGRERQVELTIADQSPPDRLVVTGTGEGLNGTLTVELLTTAPGRTRLTATGILQARTVTGRLILSSLRLIRPRAQRRFRRAIGRLATRLGPVLPETATPAGATGSARPAKAPHG